MEDRRPTDHAEPAPELSIVMPCLNEAATVGACVRMALDFLRRKGVDGEVVVGDNGSTDGSQEIARAAGARVVEVKNRGYGSALRGAMQASRGRYIIMGDSDLQHDFSDLSPFLEKLRAGHDLVQGCRLPVGGGTIKPGAMPFLHRWWGNPMFSFLVRFWFGAPIHDVYCGLRGFRKEFQQSLEQRCTGMEFAVEMIIKASLSRANFAEVPITVHPDGREIHALHLKTFRDGWRTLRFLLLCSPKWLFLIPGLLMIALGCVAAALALPGVKIGPATFGAHTLLFASLCFLLGYQSVVFGIMTKAFAISEGFIPMDQRFLRFFGIVTLERGLLGGVLAGAVGFGLLAVAVFQWQQAGFAALDYSHTMRWVIPGATLTALGFQTVLFIFFVSMMGITRRYK